MVDRTDEKGFGCIMTQNRRLLLNVVATYGRSLYALAVGIFTARWALQALGEVDYGLVGVVGGLTGFVSFLNGLLASAVSRFYGVSVGAAKRKGNELDGLRECQRWFTVAVSIHSIVPLILIAIGYPCGVWAVKHFLTIPPDRVQACIWVWRFTCMSCFIGMVSVPFSAMYRAKQEIAELTIYSFFTTTANAFFLYYMITHPGVWMAKYSLWTCALGAIPQFLIITRAIVCYKECRFVSGFFWNSGRVKEICRFAFARCLAQLAGVFAGQGSAIVVNKYLGPSFNASVTLGNTVAGHAVTLAGSVTGAFYPMITNKAGEGAFDEVRVLSLRVSRIATALVLLFAIPLSLEIEEVLRLWLIHPPVFVAEICVALLIKMVLESMSDGYWMSILSKGESVVRYSMSVCWAGFILMGTVWILFEFGLGMFSLCVGYLLHAVWLVGWRLYWGRKLVGIGVRVWLHRVFLPLTMICAVTVLCGFVPQLFLKSSPVRIAVTVLFCEIIYVPALYLWLFDSGEKKYLKGKFRNFAAKWRRGNESCICN